MLNNAQLALFSEGQRTSISLVGNFVGFAVNLGALLLLKEGSNLLPQELNGIVREYWWVSWNLFLHCAIFCSWW